jgi:hypothetical protein
MDSLMVWTWVGVKPEALSLLGRLKLSFLCTLTAEPVAKLLVPKWGI